MSTLMLLLLLLTLGCLIGVLLINIMSREAKELVVKEETINLPIEIDKKMLLFISDIHKRKISQSLLDQLPAIDYVIIGGDICEKGVNPTFLEANLATLSSLGKTFFVWGNNDYEFGETELNEYLMKHGIISLNNEAKIIGVGAKSWSIVGVEDLSYERANVDKALVNAQGPVIFVSHNPEIAYEIFTKNINIQAILSGHTHGGQIRLGPLAIAEKGGWTIKNGIKVLISNGFGTTRLPLRFGAKPEMHIITIQGISND
ncbi:metallophosphoesterase [Salipaludibacillus keqinensis]|uniref:Metallophosphoesterase n=2 Tax=Salipaludibacillus keqinensis TaxID=2045207 RepID=A0A323THU7_9BACI|nr:metallophosphoesterase [Salipaludibacillus keqinensis]